MGTVLSLLVLTAGLPPSEMAQRVAERLQHLDKIVIEFTHQAFQTPALADPLDRNLWSPAGSRGCTVNRLTILRPEARFEFLTNAPELGYVPAHYWIHAGGMVSEHVQPLKSGRRFYEIVDRNDVGLLNSIPALEAFDLNLADSPVSLFNIKRAFDDAKVDLLGADGDVSKYAALIELPDGRSQQFEFDINDQGTPLRVKSTLSWRGVNGQILTVSREHFAAGLTEINGTQIASEIVMLRPDPTKSGAPVGIDLIQVTEIASHPELTAADVAIQPELRNSVISTWRYADGHSHMSQEYDEGGTLLSTVTSEEPKYASTSWRHLAPWLSAAVGIAVCLGLVGASRRRA